MQFEIHWERISLETGVIDFYARTLPLYILAAIIITLRIRKKIRERKAIRAASKPTTVATKQEDDYLAW